MIVLEYHERHCAHTDPRPLAESLLERAGYECETVTDRVEYGTVWAWKRAPVARCRP